MRRGSYQSKVSASGLGQFDLLLRVRTSGSSKAATSRIGHLLDITCAILKKFFNFETYIVVDPGDVRN